MIKRIAYAIGLIGVSALQFVHADDNTTADTLVVTGTSIQQIARESALPVTVLKREDIERVGAADTEALLASLSITGTVGGSEMIQNAGQEDFGESTASLRNLGQQRTLILVNGRRLAAYAVDGAGVDINVIPQSAVERIEVLRDGASSIYGSDAIAGVINLHPAPGL